MSDMDITIRHEVTGLHAVRHRRNELLWQLPGAAVPEATLYRDCSPAAGPVVAHHTAEPRLP